MSIHNILFYSNANSRRSSATSAQSHPSLIVSSGLVLKLTVYCLLNFHISS